jgi:hypothetical protein
LNPRFNTTTTPNAILGMNDIITVGFVTLLDIVVYWASNRVRQVAIQSNHIIHRVEYMVPKDR